MAEKVKSRNERIAEMLASGDSIKDFYRFSAQNPHIELYDACQIIIQRPDAGVCFSFDEWNAMGRRIKTGGKGVAYFDRIRNKHHAFDEKDTVGATKYERLATPISQLVKGFDVLNGTHFATNEDMSDYERLLCGVKNYMKFDDDDKQSFELKTQGIAFTLYCMTAFPKTDGIKLNGLPYELNENAQLFIDIRAEAFALKEELLAAAERGNEQPAVIEDTDEETLSDEPVVSAAEKEDQIIRVHAAEISNYKGMDVFMWYDENSPIDFVCIGKRENYDNHGNYDNSDNSFTVISDDSTMFSFLCGEGWTETQQSFIDKGAFLPEHYKEFNDLKNGILKDFECIREVKFGIDPNVPGSGEPFRYPDWNIETEQPKQVSPFQNYFDVQNKYPNAIAVMRLGDFYEVMGDKAEYVAKTLDLTLTGRRISDNERTPMCGWPYHATDKYLNKLLETISVVVIEDGEEKYILSHEELALQNEIDELIDEEVEQNQPEEQDNELSAGADYDDDGEAKLNEEDWNDYERNRGERPWDHVDYDENSESDGEDYDDDVYDGDKPETDSDDWTEEIENAIDLTESEKKPTKEKTEKGIRDRRKKPPTQPSLFDMLQPKQKTPEEELTERGLRYGSLVEHGKFRIYEKYMSNPTVKEFAEFLKNEYGWSGVHGVEFEMQSDGKGLRFASRDKEHPENDVVVILNWTQVAYGIADIIDKSEYFTDKDQTEYAEILRLRNERESAQTVEDKIKVIVSQGLKMALSTATISEYEIEPHYFGETAQFFREHRNEIEQAFLAQKEVVGSKPTAFPWADNIHLILDPKYCERLIESKPDGVMDSVIPVNRFKELTEEDRTLFESYIRTHNHTPYGSPWGNVDSCREIANGIFDVSTEGHGGVMIASGLAPHILSPEALKIAFVHDGYYCFEEDCDASVALRELMDKSILNDDYFSHYYVKTDRAESKDGTILFNYATDAEKSAFIAQWNTSINGSLERWHPKYWEAYKKAEQLSEHGLSETESDATKGSGIETTHDRISKVVDFIVETGTRATSEGNYIIPIYDLPEELQFILDHKEEIHTELANRKEVADVEWETDEIDVNYYLNYCENLADDVAEEAYEDYGNTDLNDIGFDQSELGGAKSKFKSNIEAIQLLKSLEFSKRVATPLERKTLAKYVGWGALAEAFDEHNEKWAKEYAQLKELLMPEEYDKAKASVNNSHFTGKDVIEGIYRGLERLGVKGGAKILEPSMGTGNFFGFMPKSISEGSKLFGVEIDDITGRIAQKLYPDAKIQITGFENTTFTDDSFDVIVGNVPFGNYSVFDNPYNRYNFLIHDYFICKGLDKLKPGGVMAVITSKGTLDKLNPTARKYMAQRADLVGAMRLPNNAFKTAGTEAITDMLFFRKREEMLNDVSEVSWLGTYPMSLDGTVYDINNYFADRPGQILGKPEMATGLYGAEDLTVEPDGRSITQAIDEAIQYLPQNIYSPAADKDEFEDGDLEADYDVRPFCYKTQDGKLYMRVGDKMQIQPMPKSPKDAYTRISQMIVIRNKLREILQMQVDGCSDTQLQSAQGELNYIYDRFVRNFGFLNGATNKRLFGDDGDSALVFACENWDDNKKIATKGDIFSKRTIRPYTVITQTDDCFEALQISKNERGKVDIRYIEELTKKDKETVLYELGDAVFRNPETTTDDEYSGYETSEEYLSGHVVRKLQTARRAVADGNTQFERNVTALEKVQPEPIKAQDIGVRLGASWVDKKYYEQFLCELLGISSYYRDGVDVCYNRFDNTWKVSRTDFIRNTTRMKAYEVFGTTRASAFRLYEDCLNLRATNIYDTVEIDGKEKQVLNQQETIAAREKQTKIKEMFKDWIFNDPDRREELERTYNSLFNQIRLPSYDGSYLRFPGMNPAIELRPHQKDAVHRIITNGNTLLHHVVGSGKTYTCIASIMKQRQYGLIKKAMVAVPNHLVQQWADDWRRLYPNAKILVATKDDLSKDKRQQFVSRVAMGDWDGIIIAQSSFGKINISAIRQERKIQEEIDSITDAIHAAEEDENNWNTKRTTVKRLQSILKQKEVRLQKLLDDSKKDSVLIFENLGVDALYIDEAHYYKNLFLYTKMNNIAGISTAASARASDLQLKVEYINELHGGDKGVVFATGTPISNSMTEMYTMQTYLGKSTLRDLGITYFDNWAADFGETMTTLEMAPSGQGYRPRTRFAKFTNLPELLTLYRSFADVQTSEQVKLDVPEADKKVVTLKPSDTVIEMAEEIADRAERIYGGGVDPHEDNMLKVTTDGKKLALDPRCLDPNMPDEPNSKLNACADRVFEIWERTQKAKGTQIIFCDKSTPQCAFEEYVPGEMFDAYNELKTKLVQMGIPQEEIAFIHDAETENAKQTLFDNVNKGRVRVLIGSTEKCGAGTNAQERLFALHHLDTPYRPSDLEQREGRIIRQGNTYKNVEIYTYVTERTFDSYSYQILENKQRFISQINRGDLTVREADDIDETLLSYAEIKAITAANPKIKRKMELDTEVARLRVLEGQYKKRIYALQDEVRKAYPERIRKQELYIERLRKDLQTVKENYDPENFKISVNGTEYTDRKDGGRALTDTLFASRTGTVVAEYGGMKISLNPMDNLMDAMRTVTLAAEGQYTVDIGNSASGNLVRLDNFFKDFEKREEAAVARLEQIKADFEIAKQQLTVPFEHSEKLKELSDELVQINAELDINRTEVTTQVVDDDDSEGNYMAVPDDELAHKETRRAAHLSESTVKIYSKLKRKRSDTVVIVQNGSNYEMIGPEAKEYAESAGLAYITDDIKGAQVYILPIKADELENVVRKLHDSGKEISIVEPQNDYKEENFLEEKHEDNIPIPVFPDYTISIGQMHEYGYTWDKMLPLSAIKAKMLLKKQFEVYALHSNNKENTVRSESEIDSTVDMFGVTELEWRDFLQSSEGIGYLGARLEVADAFYTVLNEDMRDFEGKAIDVLADELHEECLDLEKFMYDKTPSFEYMESVVNDFINEYANRATKLQLEEHGWNRDSVVKAIIANIQNDELREHVVSLNKDRDFEFETKYGYEVQSLFTDGNRKYVVFRRQGDNSYGIGIGYNTKTGEWNQGRYDFDTYNEAYFNLQNSYSDLKRVKPENKGYSELVRADVLREYDTFCADEMKKDIYEIIHKDHLKLHFYNEIADYFGYGLSNLMRRDIQGLFEDSPHIIARLYSYYLKGEYGRIESHNEIEELIKSYNDYYHEDIVMDRYEYEKIQPPYYLGRDYDDRAYYAFDDKLSLDTLARIKEQASGYVVAAPVCYISQDYLDDKGIFFLKIGRDIPEDAFVSDEPTYVMYEAMNNIIRKKNEERKSTLERRIGIRDALDKAIYESFDGMHLKDGFADELMTEYGLDEIKYVVANTLQRRDYDGRYSPKNIDWAKTIGIVEDDAHRDSFILNSHPAIIDGFASMLRDKKKATFYCFVNENHRGEYVIATYALNTETGVLEPFAGAYKTMEEAEQAVKEIIEENKQNTYFIRKESYELLGMSNKKLTEKEENMPENNNEQGKTQWTRVRVPQEAIISTYDKSTFMRMPDGEYQDYTYNIYNNRIRVVAEDKAENGLKYILLLADSDTIRLKTRDGDEINFTPDEFKEVVDGKTADAYARIKANGVWYKFNIPDKAALESRSDKALKLMMPDGSKYENSVYYIPNTFTDDTVSAEGEDLIVLNLPEKLKVTLYNIDGNKTEITANELFNEIHNATADKYPAETWNKLNDATFNNGEAWKYVDVDNSAIISKYEKSTLFKMPNGTNHEGYAYYMPNGRVKANEDGSIRLSFPPDATVDLTMVEDENKITISADELIGEVQGKTKEAYITEYEMPSKWPDRFKERERMLRDKVPDEMKARPNWIIVRTRDNPEKGHKDKFLISPVTDKGADISDPTTWTDFETACKYAHENGGETLAYALDGKDKICCIDMDKSIQTNKDLSPLAQSVWETAKGSYSELSISGNGLHVFGKTDGMDLRTFSKDGSLEFYQKNHFIAVTGDDFGSKELMSFDTPEMKAILESKCDKRKPFAGTNKGVEGLSIMSDRDIVEKASKSRNGDIFTRLYRGEDVKGNHSNSDMALMNMLAFWCNGDKDQMIRIFATSGLFRPEKHASYYECTAIKAIQDIPNRYTPNIPSTPKPNNNNSGNKGGK